MTQLVGPVRDRISRHAMLILAFAASLAFAATSWRVQGAPSDVRPSDIWQMLGYLAASGIFILLAFRPRSHAGLWELALLQTFGSAIIVAGTASDAALGVAIAHGLSAIVLLICYILTRAYIAWTPNGHDVRAVTRPVLSQPV